jgi:hypothetical protein
MANEGEGTRKCHHLEGKREVFKLSEVTDKNDYFALGSDQAVVAAPENSNTRLSGPGRTGTATL